MRLSSDGRMTRFAKFMSVLLPAVVAGSISCRPSPSPTAEYANRAELKSLQNDPGLNGLSGQMDAVRRHIEGSPVRPPTADDSTRAHALVTRIRTALQKYHDVGLARADGFVQFDEPAGGTEIHLNKYVPMTKTIDVTNPHALLYHRDSAGGMRLVGAMYNVSGDATAAELEALTPLGIVRWHRHVNWCIPPLDKQERWTEKQNGRYLFGHTGIIDKRECERVGGLFRDDLAGWMTHAYVFASDDLAMIWGGAQMGGALAQQGHEH